MEAPGERLVARMFTVLFVNGIGGILKPLQIKRIARAETDARIERERRLVQAERESEEIRAGRLLVSPSGELFRLEPPTAEAGDLGRAREMPTYSDSQRMLLDSATAAMREDLRRDISVAKAVLAAEDEILRDTDGAAQSTSEEAPDIDWLHRWRAAAAEVSSDVLQTLWGRVLAGEMRNPGAFSLRTVDFLRNLSKKEAENIEHLSQYLMGEAIYRGDPELLKSEGLNFGFLQGMADLGVIATAMEGVENTYKSSRADVFEKVLPFKNRLLLITHGDPTRALVLPVYLVTELGREVARLSAVPPSERYIQAVGCAIQAQGFAVQIGDVRFREGGAVYDIVNIQPLRCP
jgi:hypothetical protein